MANNFDIYAHNIGALASAIGSGTKVPEPIKLRVLEALKSLSELMEDALLTASPEWKITANHRPEKLERHLLLMVAGRIRIEDHEYIGEAADGVEVNLGTIGEEARLNAYLANYPSPEDW